MHKLSRALVEVPVCLSGYDYKHQTWNDFGGICKSQVRFALVKMQGIPGVTTEDAAEYGVRCAYCEGAIHHEGHIEHFRRKNATHYPELTFEWTNLFLACGANGHCGHYKDRPSAPKYDPDQLIKPDEYDPDYYLFFHSKGKVRVRSGLSTNDQLRAAETIRVFGLDDSSLEGSRAKAVSAFRQKILNELDEVFSWAPADRERYFLGEIEETRWDPYATTFKHFLQSYV